MFVNGLNLSPILLTRRGGDTAEASSARVLANIYEARGDYRNALKYFKVDKDYSDSLYRLEILSRAAQHDYEKQVVPSAAEPGRQPEDEPAVAGKK